jgi:hypothetical protein
MKLKREAIWLAICAVPAAAFCWVAKDYGYSPVPFFTLAFYLVTGVVRLLIRFPK